MAKRKLQWWEVVVGFLFLTYIFGSVLVAFNSVNQHPDRARRNQFQNWRR